MKMVTFCVGIAILHSSLGLGQEPAVPVELEKLKETYQAEMARVTEPTNRRYAEALTRLQENYQRAGQADKALAVKAELDDFIEQHKKGKTRLNDKDLDGSLWQWGSGGTLTLHRQNKAEHTAWGKPGVWKRIEDLKILVTKPDGGTFTVVFTDGTLTSGSVTSDTGTKTTLTRMVK